MANQVINTRAVTCTACYTLEVEATDYVSGTTTFEYGYTDRLGTWYKLGDIGTITANGNYTFNIDITDDLTVPASTLNAQCSIDAATGLSRMSNFAIRYNDDADVTLSFGGFYLDPTCESGQYTSYCFEVDSENCTILLQWSNDKNAFGFNYVDFDFTQSLRVNGQVWFPRYLEENNQYTGSTGVNTIVSATNYKVNEVRIDELPEYIHDAIRLGRIHRFFTIDGIEYVALPGEYAPDWDAYRPMATATFEVRKKTENNENDNC